MSSTPSTLKRHNHRIHPCKTEQKQELLELLISKNSDKTILVITANDSEVISKAENVTLLNDDDLAKLPDLTCELLISYNLPQKAIVYMSRIARTTSHALILLDPAEQSLVYPIETLLGRTLMQENIEGFETIVQKAVPIKKEFKPRSNEERGEKKEYKQKSNDFKAEKKEYKPRNNEERGEKKYADKPARDEKRPAKKPYNKDASKSNSWDKKKKSSQYLGKDENGKALFSGKTGDRNHRHDGTPKDYVPKVPGRKINIQALKKAEDSK